MASASPPTTEKARIYRAYKNGDASREEVRKVFGDEFDEFEKFDELMEAVRNSTTNTPSDDLFC